ncbi:uncharacterized protein LOC117341184 isoform X1 [Pecten maximus]|uniref:uncharacterized protein LOC117341184 isoform X1 n=1 Tax=Pecten maximus TaxID=6579 RepID=UPI001459146E|nr:uncharacterized protein LOC117341184 isoform X1 [Pecten maximus]
MATMWIFLIALLPSFHSSVGVELTMTPSVVTVGEPLNLSCSVTQNRSQFASFNLANWTRIGFAKLLDGICMPTVRNTGEVCDKLCSCDEDGTSFSWVIPNVSEDWHNTGVRCYMATPGLQTSDVMIINVLSLSTSPGLTGPVTNEAMNSSTHAQTAGQGTTELMKNEGMVGNPSTNAVGVFCGIAVIFVLAVVGAVAVVYCKFFLLLFLLE